MPQLHERSPHSPSSEDEALLDRRLGASAIGGGLVQGSEAAELSGLPLLNRDQLEVMTRLSRGQTVNDMSQDMDVSSPEVGSVIDGIKELLGIDSKAAIVHQLIEDGQIEITRDSGSHISLDSFQNYLLRELAKGSSIQEIARQSKVKPNLVKTIRKQLFEEIGAKGPIDAVRRGHETGYL